jgi:lambda family phage portal protein
MSENNSMIVDAKGQPIIRAVIGSGGGYQGGRGTRDMASWSPALRSADAEILPDMKRVSARAHDLSRNYALIAGSIQVKKDNIIGTGLRLAAKPDWRALGQKREWAREISRKLEARFRTWAYGPDCFIDAERRMDFGQMQLLAYSQYEISGEITAIARFDADRGNMYGTNIKMIEPARLSNPGGLNDSAKLRGGVELGFNEEPIAYNIRSAIESDMRFSGTDTYKWDRITRYATLPNGQNWGRKNFIHIYDHDRASQTRSITKMASIIAPAFKLDKFQDTGLEAAIVNSMYAATFETDFNYVAAADALGADDLGGAADSVVQALAGFNDNSKRVQLGGVNIPHLYPGEHLNFSPSNHPGPNFAEFEKSFLRHMAAGTNLTYEQLARDYSSTNYSGARAGLQEAWKYFTGRRELIGAKFSTEIYTLWLEEELDRDPSLVPPGAPDFYEAKGAWVRSRWIGPGRGQIDPLKEGKADELEMDMGTLTLEDACAKRGLDWEEVLEQIAFENERKVELGIARSDLRAFMASEAPAA